MDIKKVILEDMNEVKRALLLLLSAQSNKPIRGKLWYQKGLFLLAKNNKALEEEADFEPYFWGPYSESADAQMDDLVQLGVVINIGNRYVLTQLGRDIANAISKDVTKPEKDLVEDVKEFFNDMTKDEMLLYVYASYPEMVEDSVEFKQLLAKRKDIANSLYRKGKISVGKAAEIAGISVEEMIKELQKRGIYEAV